MTDHTEMQIPDDVMEAARACLDEYKGSNPARRMRDAIARAILAERERCAKIAESVGNFGDYTREELTKDYGQPKFDMMHEIVAKIRSVDK